MMNVSKGNMYGFVTHTWNAIKGKCMHDCNYCYMKRFKQKPLHLDCKEFLTDLGCGNFIFVGSSVDMFAEDVPDAWIRRVLNCCCSYNNKYLFQSKNPARMLQFKEHFPVDCVWATTIESNRPLKGCNAPEPLARAVLSQFHKRMVTIEPIMDFDMNEMVTLVKSINPDWVNIGADSNANHTLNEPSKEKVLKLIEELNKFTEVRSKRNLGRILNK